MDLRDYLKVVRRRWISILLLGATFAAAAAVMSALQTPLYASNARLFISTSEKDTATAIAGGQFTAQRVKSYADLIGSRELANRVITDLGIDAKPSELAEQVSAQVGVETVNLTLTVTDTDPQVAQQLAQIYAEQLIDLVRELETPPGAANAPIKATIVDAASYSGKPVSPQPMRNIGIGLALGLLVGLGVALLRQTLDTRVRTAEELGALTERPVHGVISHDPSTKDTPLISALPPHAPRPEAFRVLRTNLQFLEVDSQHKVFVLTSAMPDEGKTTTSVNLAISLAEAGARTLLIEGDLRRPQAAVRLGLDGAVGVTTVLVGRIKWHDAITHHDPTGLDFLPAGTIPPNPAELLQSNAMAAMLDELRHAYDVIIVDAPPLLPVTDAALIAAKADGAILVARHGRVTREQVALATERVSQVDANLAGVVLNMMPAKRGNGGYGYGYGYAPVDDSAGVARRKD